MKKVSLAQKQRQHNELSRRWKLKHSARCLTLNRRWCRQNPEKARETKRKWVKNHLKQHTATRLRWKSKNLKKIKRAYKKWYILNFEKIKRISTQWRKDNPQAYRESFKHSIRKHRYGVTKEQFKILLKNQKGKCGICKKRFKNTPCIDHCHKTEKIRGLLCRKCNFGLGTFNDNSRILNQAIKYLRRAKCLKLKISK